MQGALAGLLGCVFGIIGIFAVAIVFVPLAAVCAIVGLIRGIVGGSAAGIGTSVLAGVLSVVGFMLSPTLWLVTAGMVLASQVPVAPPVTRVPYYPQRPAMAVVPGSAQALAQAKVEADAAIAECRRRRLAGELQGFVASALCSNPLIVRAYQSAGYRHMDFIDALVKERTQISEALDQGKLTEAQANAEINRYTNYLLTLEHKLDQGGQ